MTKTFEDFLSEKHAENYKGFDDDMPDAFENWLAELETDDIINYSDEYAEEVKKELINEMIKLSDKIEAEKQTPDIQEWKAFKHFRNKMRDKLKIIDDL